MDVLISEVGPRDGLQNVAPIMTLAAKKAWIEAAVSAGVREIEVGSFVPASVLPQLADTAALVAWAVKIPGLTVAALVPNYRGAVDAVAAGAHKITLPLSCSETHSLATVRRTHAQVLAEAKRIASMIAALPKTQRPHFEGSLSTAFGRMLPLNVTPYIMGLPYRIAAFETLLAWLSNRPAHAFARGADICDWAGFG